MPYHETPPELAEAIADMCMAYGGAPDGDHPDDCKCRMCFTDMIEKRIRESVANEVQIARLTLPDSS